MDGQISAVWHSSRESPARAMFELSTHPALLEPLTALLGTDELSFHRGLCRPKLPGILDAGFPWVSCTIMTRARCHTCLLTDPASRRDSIRTVSISTRTVASRKGAS